MSNNSCSPALDRVLSWAADTIEEQDAKIERLEHKLEHYRLAELKRALLVVANKKCRDRRSDPETIQQDTEIYRLRAENEKLWSWQRLGKEFGMSRNGAKEAYQRHQKRLGSGRG
jgi:hypothetical protein